MKEKCLRCDRPSKGCIPYLMTLTTPELCDWCRMWKDRFGWTNATLAEKSGVPKGTLDRVLGHNEKGVKLFTIRPVICAITGCTPEELEACEKDSVSIKELEAENEKLKAKLKAIDKEHREDTKFLQGQIKSKNFTITILGLLLFIAVSVIITALVIDRANSDIGFFWLEEAVSTIFGHNGLTTNGVDQSLNVRL